MARPTDCTPDVTREICVWLALGKSIRFACTKARIADSSYYEWRARASDGPPFSEFAEATDAARQQGEATLEQEMDEAGEGDWRAKLAKLERMHPERWARRTEHTGPRGGPIEVSTDRARELIRAELAATPAADLGMPEPDDADEEG